MTSQAAVRHFPLAVLALGAIGFISVLVSSVTSMALGTLADALDTSVGSIVWVTTVFLLAAGIALPVAGWGVDRFGARLVLLTGLVVFTAGSLASGLSPSFELLLVARAIQGLGGGALEPACLALLAQITDRHRIGAVMGLMSLLVNFAPAVGPLVGAVLLSFGDWRVIFLFAVPPVLSATLLLVVTIRAPSPPNGEPHQRDPLDVAGLLLLTVGFALLLFTLTLAAGGSPGWALLTGPAGALLLTGYAWHSLRGTRAPVIDLRLFTDRRLTGAAVIMALGGLLLFSILTITPILAEDAWGLEGLWQALPLCAFGAGMLISMSLSGALSDRTGPRPLVAAGAGSTALLFLVLAVCVQRAAPLPVSLIVLMATGLAFGAVSAPAFASIYRVLPQHIAGSGTTAVLIAVQLSASIGVTGIGVLLDNLAGDAFVTTAVVLAALMGAAAITAHRTLPGAPTATA